MESLDEIGKISNGKQSFFKYVFNFDDDTKSELLNIIQYIVIALIPIIILNKMMQRFVPEADEDKGSLELLAEVLAQCIFMFLGIFFIYRLVSYIPTYSGEKYPYFTTVVEIVPMLVILTGLNTKLGEKINILFDRLLDLWNGPQDMKKGKKGQGSVKVSQPISQNQGQNQSQGQSQNQMAMNQSLNSMGSTSISNLPPVQTQPLPDYNEMYQQDNTGMPGAASPGVESFEPMAANSGGGGSFGSAFGGGW